MTTKNVKYSAEHRARAKRENATLVTIDITPTQGTAGTVQGVIGPLDTDDVNKCWDLFNWLASDRKGVYPSPYNNKPTVPKAPRTITDYTEQELKFLLRPREVKVLCLRNGITQDAKYSLVETGRILKITRERVRSIEDKALQKLGLK